MKQKRKWTIKCKGEVHADRSKEYNIGWRMDSVPTNVALAERMGCRPGPQGLCCLVPPACHMMCLANRVFTMPTIGQVLDDGSKTVRVAATLLGWRVIQAIMQAL